MIKIFFPIIIFLCSISFNAFTQDVTSDVTHPTNDDCSNGEISIIINNGIEPINYVWSNGANSKTLENIGAGEYSVLITDALCRELSLDFELECDCSFDIYVSDFNSPSHYTNSPECENSPEAIFDDGSITIGTNPSNGNYIYNWSNGSTSNMVSNLVQGTYTVTVTKGFCTEVKSITLWACQKIVPLGLFGVCGPDSGNDGNWNGTVEVELNEIVSVNDDFPCIGLLDLEITLSGVVGTYTTHWEGDNGYFSQETDIDNLCAGEYCFIVNDGCNDVGEHCFEIVNCDDNPININATENNTCENVAFGSIELNISGGRAPYSFNWSNGEIENSIDLLSAGTYEVTVTDIVGCQTSETFEILEDTEYVEIYSGNCVFDFKCNGIIVEEKRRSGMIEEDLDDVKCIKTSTCVDDFFPSGSESLGEKELDTYVEQLNTTTDGCWDLAFKCVGLDELAFTEDDNTILLIFPTGTKSEIENSFTGAACASCFSATVCEYPGWEEFNYVTNVVDEFVTFEPNPGYSLCDDPKKECNLNFGCGFVTNPEAGGISVLWEICVDNEVCEDFDITEIDIEDYLSICDKPSDQEFIDALEFVSIDTITETRYGEDIEDRINTNKRKGESTILIYPNPTMNLFHVKWLNAEEINIERFIIVDISGNRVNLDFNQTAPNEISIDLSESQTGIYIGYFYTSSGEVFTRKIIKI